MAHLAVNIAVIQDGKILLTKRDDFETWILPSGGVEEGESLAQAAIRETKEATGLDVELTRLVGVSSRLGSWSPGYIIWFYSPGNPVAAQFSVSKGKLLPWNGLLLPKPLTRNERIDRFQKSGLSRQELYLQMIEGAELREIIEVGNV